MVNMTMRFEALHKKSADAAEKIKILPKGGLRTGKETEMRRMRIMTTNIWGDYFNNPVEVREDGIYSVYDKYKPDIIGFQEITPGWYKSGLFKRLSKEYCFVGTELFDNTNYVPLAIKKDEFYLCAKGYERLEETEDPSKAITWAVLKCGEKTFAVCNLHFWWMTGEEHDKLRVKNAKQLAALMKEIEQKYSCAVFAFGDMNCVISSEVFKVYNRAGIKLLHTLAKEKDNASSHHGDPVLGGDGKYHGKTTENDFTHSIDHIVALGGGFETKSYKLVLTGEALDSTDHSPVYADVEFI